MVWNLGSLDPAQSIEHITLAMQHEQDTNRTRRSGVQCPEKAPSLGSLDISLTQ